MSNSEKPGRELTPEEAAQLSVEVIAAAGRVLEEKHGADAGSAYRQVVTGMGKKLQELLEWKAKAELKILDLAAGPKIPKGTRIEWVKVDKYTRVEEAGYYVADGDSNTEVLSLEKGAAFKDVFGDSGGNLHVAGPFDVPN